jgi:hypothetical protein
MFEWLKNADEGWISFLFHALGVILCGVGVGGGIAFVILSLCGFFDPLVNK